jgi:hypothetical protein
MKVVLNKIMLTVARNLRNITNLQKKETIGVSVQSVKTGCLKIPIFPNPAFTLDVANVLKV